MAGSVVVTNWTPDVVALLEEGVEVANRAANRNAAMIVYPAKWVRKHPIIVTYVVNGSMVLYRLRVNFKDLVRNGVSVFGFDVVAGPDHVTGKVDAGAEYVITSEKAAVSVRIYFDEEEGRFKGFGTIVAWAEDLKRELERRGSAEKVLESYVRWVEKNFDVNILKGIGVPRTTSIDIKDGDLARLDFELGV